MSLTVIVLAVSTQVGGYSDIPNNHWAAKAVENLVTTGYLQKGNKAQFAGEKPVTRYEFAVMMNRFIDDMSRAFIRKPVRKTVNTAAIKGRANDGSQVAMVRLASDGFLPYYSPIFHGPAETISAEQFAVALGQISQRIGWCFRTQDDGEARPIGQGKKSGGGI